MRQHPKALLQRQQWWRKKTNFSISYQNMFEQHGERNKQVCDQTLELQNKETPSVWKEVTLQEQAFLGVLLLSIHRCPFLWDNWSSGWVPGTPAYVKIMARNRLLEIWSYQHFSDNSRIPRPGEENIDKLCKVINFLKTWRQTSRLIIILAANKL